MKHLKTSKTRRQSAQARLNPVAVASTLALLTGAGAVQAQQAAEPQSLETVVITGIRKSLDSAVTLKREARGLVDGIVAEDIGKFPDTNLAESMQRIAGVSIDRNMSGEGSRVTVRGVGPDFNMVLLNGRQMPSSVINGGGGGANGSRAFNFADLSSDSISALEVYKTARAESPTGGIGATINVKTARPLDVRERIASIGVKANYDASVARLPSDLKGSKVTPEISGIYSDTFGNRTLGIAISGSYSKRSSGSNMAYTQNGWNVRNYNEGPIVGVVPASNIENPPTSGLYAFTNDMRYSLTGLERERLNGQAVIQFAPTKELKFTIDQTMAVNTVKGTNAENSTWFGGTFSGTRTSGFPATKFVSGPVATPIIQTAPFDGAHDYAMNIGKFAQKTKLSSTGFNVDWKLSDALRLDLDAHHSTSRTTPDSPYGTFATMDLALFNQGNTTAYYDQKLPIYKADVTFDPMKTTITGSQFNSQLSDQTVDQFQVRGSYRLGTDDKLLAGLGFTKVNNRSAQVNNFHGDWGGIGPQGSFKDVPVAQSSLGGYFSRIPGHDDPRLYSTFYVPNFDALLKQAKLNAAQYGTSSTGGTPLSPAAVEAYFQAMPDYSTGSDWRTTEKSQSLYGQWDHSFDTAIPMNLSVGLRYESTKVESSSQVVSYSGTNWNAENEVILTGSTSAFGTKTGKYNYVLPSIDFDADLTSNLKVRASYGENIGRPGWDQMLGGLSVQQVANYRNGGQASTGDPALKPMKSKNLDLSAEWYYTKSSYMAAGVFYKKVTDFITRGTVITTVAGLNQPASGTYYAAALASGCTADNAKCLRNYIFNNYNGQPGVTLKDSTDPTFLKGDITGAVAGAQAMQFNTTTFKNGAGDTIKGLELNFQHMFGSSGFGVSGNYTYVTSGLKFNNASNGEQSGLVGISNSANLVGFYEDDSWSVRGAYNWRGQFLNNRAYGGNNDPAYTEAYGQIDASIGYKIGKNLTLQADLLNLNDGYIRQHSRTKDQLVSVVQTGRRYLIGARYRF